VPGSKRTAYRFNFPEQLVLPQTVGVDTVAITLALLLVTSTYLDEEINLEGG
jgi:hypothetical protein